MLGIDVIVLYILIVLFIFFWDGEVEWIYLRWIDLGDVDIGKLIEFDEMLELFEDDWFNLVEV